MKVARPSDSSPREQDAPELTTGPVSLTTK